MGKVKNDSSRPSAPSTTQRERNKKSEGAGTGGEKTKKPEQERKAEKPGDTNQRDNVAGTPQVYATKPQQKTPSTNIREPRETGGSSSSQTSAGINDTLPKKSTPVVESSPVVTQKPAPVPVPLIEEGGTSATPPAPTGAFTPAASTPAPVTSSTGASAPGTPTAASATTSAAAQPSLNLFPEFETTEGMGGVRVEKSQSLDDSELTQFAEILLRDTPVRESGDPILQFLNDDKAQPFNKATELVSPPTTEELEALTDKYNVEFALLYNIEQKKYILAGGEPINESQAESAAVDLGQFNDPNTGQFDSNLFLVVHTHPDPFAEDNPIKKPLPNAGTPDLPFLYSFSDTLFMNSIPQSGSLILTVKDGDEPGFLFGHSRAAEGVYLGSDHPLNPTGEVYPVSRAPREGEGYQQLGFLRYGNEYLNVLRHELLKFGYSKELIDEIWANYG